jgi:integrase
MPYLEKRRNLYYAVLTIPEDVREKLGKMRFVQSLGTPIKSVAEREAAPLIGKWKAMIAEARGNTDALTEEALRWQRHLTLQQQPSKANDPIYVTGFEVLRDQLRDRTIELSRTKGDDVAQKFRSIAEGSAQLSNEHFATWKAQLHLAAKSKDQAIKDVEALIAKFTTLGEITKSNVKKWMDEIASIGKGIASQKRILSFSRNYWKYLQSGDVVPADLDPFNGVLNISKGKKSDGKHGGSNLPYAPAEVVKLWDTAGKRKMGKAKNAPFDTQLADLILLGAYTGARIEELCSLKVSDVTEQSFRITDAKTEAGIREVPIHSCLIALVKKLTEDSTDDYLLSGLTFNKYGDRSNAIGKRYGRLKTSLGHSDAYTFHSLRSTVITQFENAGVSENLAADIVGHEKPRITYGLYSGGASLPVKKEAIELVSYPFQN